MNTQISIETLAEKLGGKLWIKGDLKRIYVDAGYNTKKMSTKAYVFQQEDGTYSIRCTVECPNQNSTWIRKEEESIVNSLSEQIASIIEEFGFVGEVVEPITDNSPIVQGYRLEWRETRVAINSYGKLADRKRQFVCTFKGHESKAPKGFIALNDDHFSQALQKESSQTCYAYGEEPTFINTEEVAKKNEELRIERKKQAIVTAQNKAIEDAKIAESKRLEAIELSAKIEAMKAEGVESPLLAWKLLGCPHPAPAEIAQMKNDSGLNWKQFVNTIA